MKIRTVHLRREASGEFTGETGSGRSIVFGDTIAADEHSPVEMIVAALAGCTAMDVTSILSKKRQVIERYEVEARAEQRAEYPQVLTLVVVTHVVEGPVVLEQAVRRAIELSATKYCPVSAMLSAGPTEIHHRYRMRCTGPAPKEAEGEVIVTGPFSPADILPA